MPFAEATVLRQHRVQYYRCLRCGFIQTETPYWLDEAYSEALTVEDVGLVRRNMVTSWVAQSVLLGTGVADHGARFLDYGGGNGMFVRLMRDAGFDFYWQDRYAKNEFARGFGLDEAPLGRFALATAFEVFEHLTDPHAELAAMLERAESVLISQHLVPDPPPLPGAWWYYSLNGGQHIAFYTTRALDHLAARHGLRRHSAGVFHLLTARPIAPWRFRLATRYPVAMLANLGVLASRRSLTQRDYERLTTK